MPVTHGVASSSLVAPAIKKAGFIPVFLMAWTDALEGETPVASKGIKKLTKCQFF